MIRGRVTPRVFFAEECGKKYRAARCLSSSLSRSKAGVYLESRRFKSDLASDMSISLSKSVLLIIRCKHAKSRGRRRTRHSPPMTLPFAIDLLAGVDCCQGLENFRLDVGGQHPNTTVGEELLYCFVRHVPAAFQPGGLGNEFRSEKPAPCVILRQFDDFVDLGVCKDVVRFLFRRFVYSWRSYPMILWRN